MHARYWVSTTVGRHDVCVGVRLDHDAIRRGAETLFRIVVGDGATTTRDLDSTDRPNFGGHWQSRVTYKHSTYDPLHRGGEE